MSRGVPYRLLRLVLCLLPAASTTVAPSAGDALRSAPGIAWDVALVAQPTNLALTGDRLGEPTDQYVLALTNTGTEKSDGAIEVTLTLPAGVTGGRGMGGLGWECPAGVGTTVVTCVYDGVIPGLGRSTVLTIPVAVAVWGVLTARAVVSGGGAAVAVTSRSTEAGAPPPPFGFVDFSSLTSAASGLPETQAGGHPLAFTTIVDFPQREVEGGGYPGHSVRSPKAIEIDLPPGLVATTQAAPTCPIEAVLADACPANTRVGTFMANYDQGLFSGGGEFPIYNVTPERGYPAEFGFFASTIGKVVFVYASVRVPEYGLRISIPDLPNEIATNVMVTLFGDPQSVDGGENSPVALFTNPSTCSAGPLVTSVRADSWIEPDNWVQASASSPPVAGCDLLQFRPAITVRPEGTLADEPTGYGVDVEVPQSQPFGVTGLATPDLKSATVTFPKGVAISPGAADGLVGCTAEGPEGVNLTSSEAGHCPLASQVGTAEARTPLLAEALTGHVYLARPNCGGASQPACTNADAVDGNLFGLYVELEGSGVVIKQHGILSANPSTGQLSASFKNAPQLPLGDLRLTLKGGPRAVLANPQACGEALATSDITPWSTPETPDANPSWAFAVTGCDGSPFTPTLLAGTTNPSAGAYTALTATFSRGESQQDLGAIQMDMPPGLLAVLSQLLPCEAARAAMGTCSSGSRIGTATAGAGAGAHPLWISGPIYLTGPYRSAPFGLSIAIDARVGPFDLGTVVTRAMLNIDPETSALTITSDPLPQILDGVPLRVQTLNVTVDRAQFMLNPTSCETQQILATVVSVQNAAARVSSPFTATGCENLPFAPNIKASTRASGSKRNGAGFDVKISHGLGEANIHSIAVTLPKQLPSRLSTIQHACRRATFTTNPATCPPSSLIGIATAVSPILPVTLTGPAYLVSHGGEAFPSIESILQGDGVRINLTGSLSVVHGVTAATFADVPDAPVSSFELRLPTGPNSALATNGNLCAKRLLMPIALVGQNGRRLVRSTKLMVAACPHRLKKSELSRVG